MLKYFLLSLGEFYVPLLRAVDESLPAKVENPLKPAKLIETLDSGVQESPQSSPRVIKAVAGPMSPSDVRLFRLSFVS